jgi:hypothetical protein
MVRYHATGRLVSRTPLCAHHIAPIFMYEIYPGGFAMRYNLGVVQPGYYYLWYYADTPGRHIEVLGINSDYSNKVVVDVYTISVPKPTPPKPVPPDPKRECENRGFPCVWQDGACICKPAPNPVAECEKNANCHWANGQCLCTMPNPGPMPGPVPNPTPEPMPGPVPNPNPDDDQGNNA